MYEETTAGQAGGGDSSEEDEDEQKEPPPEPPRFGWVQGVMVGGGSEQCGGSEPRSCFTNTSLPSALTS